jgi:hypothetical protein
MKRLIIAAFALAGLLGRGAAKAARLDFPPPICIMEKLRIVEIVWT